jgi:hypothetical protein
VIVGGILTTTVAVPDCAVSCTEVAVTIAVPALAGVKTPFPSTDPIPTGLIDQVTAELYAPVPWTLAEHAEVWVVRMDARAQATETEVIATGTVAVTVASPDLVASWAEVAVIVAVPAAVGVKTPEEVMVPPVADQVTAEL